MVPAHQLVDVHAVYLREPSRLRHIAAGGLVDYLVPPSASGTRASWTITSLLADTAYAFAVRVRDEQANHSGYATIQATTLDTTAPASVHSFGVLFVGPSVRSGWENPIDPDRVAVQMRYAAETCPAGGDSAPFLQTADVLGAFTDLLTEGLILQVDTDYCFTAIAIDEVPNLSDPAVDWLCVGDDPGTEAVGLCPR